MINDNSDYTVILSLAPIQEGQLSVSQLSVSEERMCTTKSAHEKCG